MKIIVYIVGKDTGEVDADGNKILLVYAEKMTYAQASLVADRNPGTDVFKRTIYKDGHTVCNRLQN